MSAKAPASPSTKPLGTNAQAILPSANAPAIPPTADMPAKAPVSLSIKPPGTNVPANPPSANAPAIPPGTNVPASPARSRHKDDPDQPPIS